MVTPAGVFFIRSHADREDKGSYRAEKAYWGVGRPVAELVGIEGGVVSGVFNLESSDVGASDRRPRHEENYHEV